jgi:hypothetical protein
MNSAMLQQINLFRPSLFPSDFCVTYECSVARRVSEKIAQNVAQPIFAYVLLTVEKSSQKCATFVDFQKSQK